jgi:RNA polymerase sigma-70 factor (ECF subfamily)
MVGLPLKELTLTWVYRSQTGERMASEGSSEQEIEIELLKRIGCGDRSSFEELHDRLSGILFSAALKILGDQREAEDVLQDVFIQIWDKAKLYDFARGKPLTWGMTLTRNKAIDRLRLTQRRFRLRDQIEREMEISSQSSRRSSNNNIIDSLEKNRIIRSAISQLSKEQREAIELAFFSGMTQNEIAEELRQPLGTVKARVRSGMMRLKEIIGSKL